MDLQPSKRLPPPPPLGLRLCLPEDVEGLSILDLGSGSGRDVYIASQLVGPKGRAVGAQSPAFRHPRKTCPELPALEGGAVCGIFSTTKRCEMLTGPARAA